MTEKAFRVFVSSPSFARGERREIELAFAHLNARLMGYAHIDWTGSHGFDGTGVQTQARAKDRISSCDAIIAVLRPRLPGDPAGFEPNSDDSHAGGGAAGVLRAVEGRAAGAPMPDILILRYANALSRAADDRDWAQGRTLFRNWFRKKGGNFLRFGDFSETDEFAAKLKDGLLLWLDERGVALPPLIPAAESEAEDLSANETALAAPLSIGEGDSAASEQPSPATSSNVETDSGLPETDQTATAAFDVEQLATAVEVEPAPVPEPAPVAEVAAVWESHAEAAVIDAVVEDIPQAAPIAVAASADVDDIIHAANPGEPEASEPEDVSTENAGHDDSTGHLDTVPSGEATPATVTPDFSQADEGGEPTGGSSASEPAEVEHSTVATEEPSGPPSPVTPDPLVNIEPEPTSSSEPVVEQPIVVAPVASEFPDGAKVAQPHPEPQVLGLPAPDPNGQAEDNAIGLPTELSAQPAVQPAPAATSEPVESLSRPVQFPVSEVAAVQQPAEAVAEPKEPVGAIRRNDFLSQPEAEQRFRAPANDRAARIAGVSQYQQPGRIDEMDAANDRRGGRGVAIGLAAAFLAAAAVAAWLWHGAAQERDTAHESLTRAADAAGDLVFSLSQRFRSDAGASDAESKAILDQAQKLHNLLLQSAPADPQQRQNQANALKSSAEESLKRGDMSAALKAAMGAQQLFQVLATAEPNQVEWRRQLAASKKRLGDAWVAENRFAEGVTAYGDSLLISKALAAQSPESIEWRRLQWDAELALGNAFSLQGRLDESLASYREGVGIADALSVKDPGNSEWQEDIATGDVKIGGVFVAQNHLDEALAAYRDSLSIRKSLTLLDPASTQRQRDLAFSMQKVGDVLVVRGHLDEGLAAYKDGLGVRLALVMKDGTNAEWRRELYETADSVGDVLAAQNHFDEALAAYREGFAVASSTVQKNPGDIAWQRILTLCDNKIGDVLMARGQADDALAAYREGLGVVKALASKAPDNVDWQSLLATGNERMGDVFASEQHRESALAAYHDALGIVAALAKKEPGNDGWQHGISETQLRIGAVLFDQGHVDDAIDAHRESLAVVRAMVQKDPGNVRWQRDLLMDNIKIGQLLVSKGNRDDALLTYREGLAIAKGLSSKEPDNPEWQSSQAMIDSNIGALLMGQGKRDDALANYHDGLTVAKSLAARDSQNIEWQTSLIVALYNLAEVGEESSANFSQALDVLKRLDASGVLPPEKKELMAKIEGKLASTNKRRAAAD